jgi:hypothetical protein
VDDSTIQRIFRHANVSTTKESYIKVREHNALLGYRNWKRKFGGPRLCSEEFPQSVFLDLQLTYSARRASDG